MTFLYYDYPQPLNNGKGQTTSGLKSATLKFAFNK